MSNWSLIGPTDPNTVFDEQVNLSNSSAKLTVSTANTWIEYSASWPFTTNRLSLRVASLSANRAATVKVGVGAAGSEHTIFELPLSDYNQPQVKVELPVTVRAGERVACQITAAATTIDFLLSGSFDPLFRTDLRYADPYGVSADLGTVVDPGASLNTKGAWTEIAAATSNDLTALIAFFHNNKNPDLTAVWNVFDIGVGASGSEVVLLKDLPVLRSGRTCDLKTNIYMAPVHLPAGTRIAARCQADNNTVGVRDLVACAVLGLR